MSLSTILSTEPSLFVTHKFAFEILNRLRVAEPECAYYMLHNPLYKLYRPSSSADAVTFHLLEPISVLADLIHTAYSATLRGKSKNQLKTVVMGMFPRQKDYEIKAAIISYVDTCNKKITCAFDNVQQFNDQLSVIKTLLLKAFPTINREGLHTALDDMMTHYSNQLKSSLSAAGDKEIDYDFVDSAYLINNSFFTNSQESSKKPSEENKPSCTIS